MLGWSAVERGTIGRQALPETHLKAKTTSTPRAARLRQLMPALRQAATGKPERTESAVALTAQNANQAFVIGWTSQFSSESARLRDQKSVIGEH